MRCRPAWSSSSTGLTNCANACASGQATAATAVRYAARPSRPRGASMVSSPNLTALLGDWSRGDRTALSQLLPLVYDELRRVARRQLRRERADHTLQPTALVHETFLRLVDQRNVDYEDRAHFFGVAAQVMRRILVDHA